MCAATIIGVGVRVTVGEGDAVAVFAGVTVGRDVGVFSGKVGVAEARAVWDGVGEAAGAVEAAAPWQAASKRHRLTKTPFLRGFIVLY